MSNTIYNWAKQIKLYKGTPGISHSSRPYKKDIAPRVTDFDRITKRVWEELEKLDENTTRILAIGTDAYTADENPSFKVNDEDRILIAKFENANTGAVTLNLDGIGIVSVRKHDGTGVLVDLVAGDIFPNADYFLTYDNTQYILFTNGAGSSSNTLLFKAGVTSNPGKGIFATWAEIKTEVDLLVAAGAQYKIIIDNSVAPTNMTATTDLTGATLSACISSLSVKLIIDDGVKITGSLCKVENRLVLRSESSSSVIDFTGFTILVSGDSSYESTTTPMFTIAAGATLVFAFNRGELIDSGSEVFNLLNATSTLLIFLTNRSVIFDNTLSGVAGSVINVDIDDSNTSLSESHVNFLGTLTSELESKSELIEYIPAIPANYPINTDNVKDALDSISDQSDAEIETAYNNQVSVVSQAEAEAGISTTVRRWTALRVAQAIAALGLGGGATLRNVTTTDTFATANETINCTSGTFTVNLPTAVGIQGTTYILVNSGAGTITLDPNGAETINGSLTITIATQISRTVQSDGTNWIII